MSKNPHKTDLSENLPLHGIPVTPYIVSALPRMTHSFIYLAGLPVHVRQQARRCCQMLLQHRANRLFLSLGLLFR